MPYCSPQTLKLSRLIKRKHLLFKRTGANSTFQYCFRSGLSRYFIMANIIDTTTYSIVIFTSNDILDFIEVVKLCLKFTLLKNFKNSL